jgi:hypothetical protein
MIKDLIEPVSQQPVGCEEEIATKERPAAAEASNVAEAVSAKGIVGMHGPR